MILKIYFKSIRYNSIYYVYIYSKHHLRMAYPIYLSKFYYRHRFVKSQLKRNNLFYKFHGNIIETVARPWSNACVVRSISAH